jgi:hypothetical protein
MGFYFNRSIKFKEKYQVQVKKSSRGESTDEYLYFGNQGQQVDIGISRISPMHYRARNRV